MRAHCLIMPPQKRHRKKPKNYTQGFIIILLILIVAACARQHRANLDRNEKTSGFINELIRIPEQDSSLNNIRRSQELYKQLLVR
jgi:hypothetical protein